MIVYKSSSAHFFPRILSQGPNNNVNNLPAKFNRCGTKVDVPNSSIAIIWTLVFEWYMVRCRSKNGHQKDMCLVEVELRAQNMLIILVSIINIIAETYMTT